jgi:hypothetical protein
MNKEILESTITEDDFTIDNMGRITIIDNKELLETISGGETTIGMYEVKSSFFGSLLDEVPLSDTLGNNCNCGSGSGSSGTGSGTGGCTGSCGCTYC